MEIAKRPRISGAQSRAFGLALAGAFKSKPRITPERPKPNQLLVDVQDEDEPLIDLSDNWQKNPVKDLDQFVVTVKPVNKPVPESDPTVNRTPTTSSILSPWSKPFNPRREDGHVTRHSVDQPLTGVRRAYPPAFSSAQHPASRVSDSIFRIPPLNRTLSAVPQAIGSQLPTNAIRPSGKSPVQPPVSTAHPATSPASAIVPLFAPRAAKVVSIRAPASSTIQPPETTSKVRSGSSPKSLVQNRVALPYEDDYDSDEDPFYPVATKSHRGRDDPFTQADSTDQKTVKGLGLQLHGRQEPNTEGIEHLQEAAPMQCSSPRSERLTSTSHTHALSQDQFSSVWKIATTDTALVTVALQTSTDDCSTVSQAPAALAGTSSSTPSASPRPIGGHDTVAIPNHGSSKQGIAIELKSPQSSRSYDFTFCRAHLGELSCPYGKYCCFKHPRMREPISSEQLAQLEHGLSREEQEKVNCGKIRGLLTTRSITVTPDDGTALIVLYADAVCENAGTRTKRATVSPATTESPDVDDSSVEGSSTHADTPRETPKTQPEWSALRPAATDSPDESDGLLEGATAVSITAKLEQMSVRNCEDLRPPIPVSLTWPFYCESIKAEYRYAALANPSQTAIRMINNDECENERGISDQVMAFRHPPPDQEDID